MRAAGQAAGRGIALLVLFRLLGCQSHDISEAAAAQRPPDSAAPAAAAASAAPAGSSADSAAPELRAEVAGAACQPSCHDIERCDPGRGGCVPACPEGEIYVPVTGAEGFTMGAGLDQQDKPRDKPHKVVLTKPFCMDALEVTAGQYKRCVDEGHCPEPRLWGLWINYSKLPDHPINKVDWKQARKFCRHQGKDLPTEAQWEWAATGGDGRKWAWGNELPDCTRCDFTQGVLPGPSPDAGCHGGGTSPVGAHPAGAKPWPAGKIHDLTGNVWEWCLDNILPYSGLPEVDPLHLTREDGAHVVRGGGWNRSARGVRTQYRGGAVVGYQVPGLGFRCVRNPK